jgi:hypothetical protein
MPTFWLFLLRKTIVLHENNAVVVFNVDQTVVTANRIQVCNTLALFVEVPSNTSKICHKNFNLHSRFALELLLFNAVVHTLGKGLENGSRLCKAAQKHLINTQIVAFGALLGQLF